MEIVEWYLDKATKQIPGCLERQRVREELLEHLEEHAERYMEEGMTQEAAYREAVEAMGDAEELARQLGQIHSYDREAGFSFSVGMLWIGLLLCGLRFGSDSLQRIELLIGAGLLSVSLFRLRKVNSGFRYGFLMYYASVVLMAFGIAWTAFAPSVWRTFLSALCIVGSGICRVIGIWRIFDGTEEMISDEYAGKLSFLRWIMSANAVLGVIAYAVNGFEPGRIDISISDLNVFLLIPIGMLILLIVCWKNLWRIKKALQEEAEGEVDAFCFWTFAPWLAGYAAAFAAVLGIVCAASLVPARTDEYRAGRETSPDTVQKAEQVLLRNEQNESGDIELLLSVLPKEELELLAEAEDIRLERGDISPGESKGEVLFLTMYFGDSANPDQVSRCGCLTVWKKPYHAYTAASGFWVSALPEREEERKPCMALAAEKNGVLFSMEPKQSLEEGVVSGVEYTLNQDADRIYCYQAFSFFPGDQRAAMGYQAAVRYSLLRVPYKEIELLSGAYGTISNNSFSSSLLWESNMSLLTPETVYQNSDSVWNKYGTLVYLEGR